MKLILLMNFVFIIVSRNAYMPDSMLYHRGVSYLHHIYRLLEVNQL